MDWELAGTFVSWVCAQDVDGYQTSLVGERQVRLDGTAHVGEINLYDLEGETHPVVEMRVTRLSDEEPVFFLHFMLDDLMRARELFGEMAEALHELASERKVRVLLSCTCGITTTMFAHKMSEIAATIGLPYEVQAKSLDRAVGEREPFDVVMLAPQVAYERGKVAAAYPDAVVFEIPARIFGSYDAVAAMRLLSNALDGHNREESHAADAAALPHAVSYPGCIMVATAVYGARQSTCEYRVFDGGEVVLSGASSKRSFEFRDVEDLLANVRLQGFDVGRLDAIGIAVPGIVEGDGVSLVPDGILDYDLGGRIHAAYGVPVYVDNDANAAAVGCYATQSSAECLTYHRESFGHSTAGQGMVIDGRLHRGRRGLSGEVLHLLDVMNFSDDPESLAWTEEGMYELVSRWLLVNIVEIAPDAIYVDAWPATDMARLRVRLAEQLDERYIPKLIPAPDFTEVTLLGELALCAQRLRVGEAR